MAHQPICFFILASVILIALAIYSYFQWPIYDTIQILMTILPFIMLSIIFRKQIKDKKR